MARLQGGQLSQEAQQAEGLAPTYLCEKGSSPSDVRKHVLLRRCHPPDGLNSEVSRFMLSKMLVLQQPLEPRSS